MVRNSAAKKNILKIVLKPHEKSLEITVRVTLSSIPIVLGE